LYSLLNIAEDNKQKEKEPIIDVKQNPSRSKFQSRKGSDNTRKSRQNSQVTQKSRRDHSRKSIRTYTDNEQELYRVFAKDPFETRLKPSGRGHTKEDFRLSSQNMIFCEDESLNFDSDNNSE
jgi:hypothetical protein